MTDTVLQRVVRRETHSPRTAMTVIALVVIVLLAVYAGIEIVLHLAGAGPMLLAPGAALAWLVAMPTDQPQPAVIAAGALVAVVGVVLVWLALAPGRRPKHALALAPATVVVVDNGVIAAAVAERLRRELDVAGDGVVVGISHRSADVTVRPEPGQQLDTALVRSVAEAELAGYATSPALRVRARVVRAADTEETS